MSKRILLLDIETKPLLVWVWGLFEQFVGLEQVKEDWNVMAWSAKWLGDPDSKIMYQDRRSSKSDKSILKGIHKLLDKADVVITQNGIKFDERKLNARFEIQGMNPPSPFKHIDTYKIGKKYCGFTSHKLEYMAKVLNVKYKKLTNRKFPGLSLWTECINGNIKAWNEMKRYNCRDVLATEGVFNKLKKWDRSINFSYLEDKVNLDKCVKCESNKIQRRGFELTNSRGVFGKYQRYQCQDCGSWSRDKKNLFTKEKQIIHRK